MAKYWSNGAFMLIAHHSLARAESHQTEDPRAGIGNLESANYALIALAGVAFLSIVYRLTRSLDRHIRRLFCLSNDVQNYFRDQSWVFSIVKRHFLYAPLFGSRHVKEMAFTSRWVLGILPSRVQSIFLAGVVAMNLTLCVTGIEWEQRGTPLMLAHLRNRAGTLAVANIIPLVLVAGRNNPLIRLANLPFDTFNLIHRWLGRVVVGLACVHTVSFAINAVNSMGWSAIAAGLRESRMMITGFIALVALLVILIQSSSAIRHAAYEVFLHMHILLVITVFVALWYHLDGKESQIYMKIAIGLWGGERVCRFLTLLYRNFSRDGTQVLVEKLPGDTMRLTINMARPWRYRPGQYLFLTIPSVGLWASHPFSVAWSEEQGSSEIISEPSSPEDIEKALPRLPSPLSHHAESILAEHKTSVSAILRRRDGFTRQLYDRLSKAPSGCLTANALIEGPYGGLHDFSSYGTVLLLAGGVGITHQLGHARSLVADFGTGSMVAARRIILVWAVQTPEQLEWVRPWMSALLDLPRRREVLRVALFITRPTPAAREAIRSPSASVGMFPGRPDISALVRAEADAQVGAMAVSACGPPGFVDKAREATREAQGVGRCIDFVQESFTW